MEKLSPRDRVLLAFEDRSSGALPGRKAEAVRSTFGLSMVRYTQLIMAIIDTPAAMVEQPMVVKRLQRERDRLVADRAARRLPRGA